MSRIRTNNITNRMANGAPTVSNGLVISGVTTTSDVNVGTGVTLNVYGGATYSGIITATSFVGSGANLTGIDATKIITGNTQVQTIDTGSDGHVKVTTEGSERLRIDSSGRLLFGINSSISGIPIQIASGYIQQYVAGNNADPGYLDILKTRNTSPSGNTILQDGDKIGSLRFRGNTGSGYVNGAVIRAVVNGTPGSGNDLPTELQFHTMPDGSGSTMERLRIEADGDFRLSYDDAGTNYSFIRGWDASTGNMIIGADQSATGSSGSNLIFRTRGAEKARIINSGGITFNGDTAAANALDDYEEGTWTPSIYSGGSPSYSQQAGLYTKIGNLVTHVFVMSYSGASSSTNTRIQGLPFAYNSTFETTTNLGRIGTAWNDAESAGSRACHAVGHTGSGTSMIYVDLLTSGTDKTLRGFFQMRVP